MQILDKGFPVPSKDFQLGMTYSDGNTEFALWAPGAECVSAFIYETWDAEKPCRVLPLSYDPQTGVWVCSCVHENAVPFSDLEGLFYEFNLVRDGVTKIVRDPYAVSLACFTGDDRNCRAAVIDIKSPKAKADGGWFPDARNPLLNKNDAIIYESSVRDFTISGDSGVYLEKGTFEAYIEKLPYITSLGVNYIQLMPVLAFANHDERVRSFQTSETGCNYNWGYDPRGYFSPDGWFSADPEDPYLRIHELRNLVAAAHSMGIRVILDVVYNHVSNPAYLEDIVPGYYFRRDCNGNLKNASGCGNDLATERYMVRKLIVDSVRYLMRSFRVDGFRFDLMGLIDTETIQEAYNAGLKILPDLLFIGEGWIMYDGEPETQGMDQNFVKMTLNVSVFNDGFRDIAKGGGLDEFAGGFLTGKMNRAILPGAAPDLRRQDVDDTQRLFRQMTGYAERYATLVPDTNVQYLACHDGLTLHDSLCVTVPLDPDNADDQDELFRRQRIANFILLTSQGIVFLQGGQEYGRSKRAVLNCSDCIGGFVRNSYNSGDDVNKIIWTLTLRQQHLMEYTSALIKLRKRLSMFHLNDYAEIESHCRLLRDSGGGALGYSITDTSGAAWFILYNMTEGTRTFRLCDSSGTAVSNLTLFADESAVYQNPVNSSASVKRDDSIVYMQPLSCALFGPEDVLRTTETDNALFDFS